MQATWQKNNLIQWPGLKYPVFQKIFFSYWYWGIKRQRSAKRWKKKNNLWSQELRVSFRREVPREKHNLRSQELQVSFPCNFRIISNRFGVDVHVCFHWRWQLRFDHTRLYLRDAWKKNCAKAYLERKVLLKIKLSQILFQKKYTSSCKYIKRTKVSWEVHTLYVFRSKQDKKDFRSATLVLLYQVKLNIARQNGCANKTSFCCIYLENKLRHELSGIRKKGKTFCI